MALETMEIILPTALTRICSSGRGKTQERKGGYWGEAGKGDDEENKVSIGQMCAAKPRMA